MPLIFGFAVAEQNKMVHNLKGLLVYFKALRLILVYLCLLFQQSLQ